MVLSASFRRVFFFRHRSIFLLSSPKEETRKVPPFRIGGRRPEGLPLWTPAHDKIPVFPASPAPGLTLQAGWNGSPVAGRLRTLLQRGAVGSALFLGKALRNLVQRCIWPIRCLFLSCFAVGTWHVALGPQGRAESSAWRNGRPFIFGGGPGGKTPRSASTARNGGTFLAYFFR